METDDDRSVSSYQVKSNRTIRLTIVSDIDGSTRGKNGENAGIVKASCVCGTVLDLEGGTERISTSVR